MVLDKFSTRTKINLSLTVRFERTKKKLKICRVWMAIDLIWKRSLSRINWKDCDVNIAKGTTDLRVEFTLPK